MVLRSCGHNKNMLSIESGLIWASLRLGARVHAMPIAGCVRFPESGAVPFFATLAKLSFDYVPKPLKIITGIRSKEHSLSWEFLFL